MNPETWWALGGVFVGGALPWLEAVVVVPAGILGGLPVVPVIVAGACGNLLTVGIAAYGGERIKRRWSAWCRRRRAATGRDGSEAAGRRAARAAGRRARIERLMRRGGLPLLALVGPLGIGTQISAVVAVAAGTRATPAFLWVGAGTLLWCVVAAAATTSGLSLFGVGG